jgi:hypothetical protein
MTSMDHDHPLRRVVVGVDTHKYVHVAAAVCESEALLEAHSFAADRSGYEQLVTWATDFGALLIFGVEGSGALLRPGLEPLRALLDHRQLERDLLGLGGDLRRPGGRGRPRRPARASR